jgi:hypothetical protein
MAASSPAGVTKRQQAMGWAAVIVTTALAMIVASFAGGGVITARWYEAAILTVQMLVVMVPPLFALRWPRVGGILVMVSGVVLVALLAIPALFTDEPVRALGAVGLFFPLIIILVVAGALYIYGRPRPLKLAYMAAIVVPLIAFTASTFTANEPPAVERVAPAEKAVMVGVGQSVTFTALARDPEGELAGMGWAVDEKEQEGTHKELSGAQAQESLTVSFPSAGTFIVEAGFTDRSDWYSSVTWEVTVK